MTIWKPEPSSLKSPLHESLAHSIAQAIAEGKLPIGTRLPTHRKMAEDLGLSVHTVSKAYESLSRQKLIDGQVGRGSYVATPEASNAQPFELSSERGNGFDLSISRPAFSQEHVDLFQQTLKDLHKDLDPSYFLSCRPNVGHDSHRAAGTVWLRQCGLDVPAERIIMTNGVSHGMSAALSSLTRPGDTVVSSKITHHLLVSGCSYLGLNLVGVETDDYGILPEALEKCCLETRVKVLFLLPSLANATAEMMPENRRRELVAIAEKYDLQIIEDDAFGPVAADRPIPITALAPSRSIYLTTFSKCTVSGLRVGYMVAPEHLLPAIIARLVVFGWMATPLMCEIASRWVHDGTALHLARWQGKVLRERFDIASQILPEKSWRGHPAALHLWLNLPLGWTTQSFVAYAKELNVSIAPDTPFLTPKTQSTNAVRISLASVQELEGFKQALELLSAMLGHPPEGMVSFST